MIIGTAHSLLMRLPSGCFGTLWSIGTKVHDQFIAFPKIEQELMHGVGFVLKAKPVFFVFAIT